MPATADLSIIKTDGQQTYVPDSTIIYTIFAANAGPADVSGATVTDNFSSQITAASFRCSGSNGGSCPQFGAGNISALVNLPAAASVTFTVTARVSAAATGDLVNTATISAPAGVADPNTTNNTSNDINTLRVTAAGVEVSGRVLTPDGRGLRNAQVVLLDSSGVARTVMTSSFGYYSFTDVEAGQAYIIGVRSKRFRFQSRVIEVADTLADVDFWGIE